MATRKSQFQFFEKLPLEPKRISKPVFLILPTLTFGEVASPSKSGNCTGNKRPFVFLSYQSNVTLSFPFHKTDSKPKLVTASSCQPVLGLPILTVLNPCGMMPVLT